TLYGRNTTSGAVNFHTRRPTHELEGYGNLSYGSNTDIYFEGAMGGPLSDQLAGRIAVVTHQRANGWLRTRVTGEDIGEVDRTSVRGQLLWTPRDDLEVLV